MTLLTATQREEVARLQDVQRDLCAVLTQILELTDELARGTIERQLAKSDLEQGDLNAYAQLVDSWVAQPLMASCV
ncbi:MAG TPA: hypothetical protein VF526_19770 [Solirubrobacteraceae bacterium]